jgi:predicted Zn-dependent peptidase
MIKHHKEASYFVVDTEVGNEVCHDAVKEIIKEMELMNDIPVSDHELTIVRNYMIGSLIRATDGPFNRIKVIKNMVLSNVDVSYFNRLVDAVQHATPESVKLMSSKYLQPDMYKQIICGNPITEPVA